MAKCSTTGDSRRISVQPSSPSGPERSASPLRLAFVASEAHPFASTGGLAEVVGALPQTLARLGHQTTVILPQYRQVARRAPEALAQATVVDHVVLPFDGHPQSLTFRRHAPTGRMDVVFVDAPALFDREGLYSTADGDHPDNGLRFAVLCRAALEYLRRRGERPTVIHAHDWQAGLVAAYQKMLFADDPVVGGVPVVFTIHNIAFQGIYPSSILPQIGLPWRAMDGEGMEYWGRVSYLKAGITFSERITTVSPSHAREILSSEQGCGLDGVLTRRAGDLVGILNGIDTARWNPEANRFLPASFSADDLAGKEMAKRALLQRVGLPAANGALGRPLVAMVSRFTNQKGLDLIAAAADELMALDASWVVLGSGERRYEDLWRGLAARLPARVSATIGYDERLEHAIGAGADMFLMPSRFEPCGLNQLHAQRYGAPPIVRATGGLDDTVVDASANGSGTGFKFDDYTPEALLAAMRRALSAYRQPEVWRTLQRNAMRRDSSWDAAAREYVKVYSALS
jgi:starch synthase